MSDGRRRKSGREPHLKWQFSTLQILKCGEWSFKCRQKFLGLFWPGFSFCFSTGDLPYLFIINGNAHYFPIWYFFRYLKRNPRGLLSQNSDCIIDVIMMCFTVALQFNWLLWEALYTVNILFLCLLFHGPDSHNLDMSQIAPHSASSPVGTTPGVTDYWMWIKVSVTGNVSLVPVKWMMSKARL